MVNADPHNQQDKGLVPIPTPQGEIMWVYLDLIESHQWTTIFNRKSKGKARASPYNVVCASSKQTETDVASFIDSKEEIIVLVA